MAYQPDLTLEVNVTNTTFNAGKEGYIKCDCTSNAITVTLPDATKVVQNGRYSIEKSDSSANAVTVNTTASQKINGASSFSLPGQYDVLEIFSDGSNWYIISQIPGGSGAPSGADYLLYPNSDTSQLPNSSLLQHGNNVFYTAGTNTLTEQVFPYSYLHTSGITTLSSSSNTVLYCDPGVAGGSMQLNLPAVSTCSGKLFLIKFINNSTFSLTVSANGGDYINQFESNVTVTSLTLATKNSWVLLQADSTSATSWEILNNSNTFYTSLTSINSPFTITNLGINCVWKGDCTSGAITITLPDASYVPGTQHTFKKVDDSANSLTIGTTSSQTIDGQFNVALSDIQSSITVISDGTNWQVLDLEFPISPNFTNYFGNGTLGSVTYSSNTTITTGLSQDSSFFVSNYDSLTVNASQSVTLDKRVQAWLVYVRKDCTINGTLTMSNNGASGSASAINLAKYNPVSQTGWFQSELDYQGVLPTITTYTSVQPGGSGGTGANSGASGNTGGTIANGTGGGGSGGNAKNSTGTNTGGDGTAYVGGSGGGGCASSTTQAGAGGANGGAGGNGTNNSTNGAGAGGAGNDNGTGTNSGTGSSTSAPGGGGGGTLILVVGGNLSEGSSSIISANGGAGGGAVAGSASTASGGGGSGGGRVIVLYGGTLTQTAGFAITASGGGIGTASGGNKDLTGGAGGAGTVTSAAQILNIVEIV